MNALDPQEWNRRYNEAMQWRDWQMCDYLLTIRPPAPATTEPGETT